MNIKGFYVTWFIVISLISLISCSDSEILDVKSSMDFTIENTGPYIAAPAYLDVVKDNLDDPILAAEYSILIEGANKLLDREIEYVTAKPTPPPSGDVHDYMSLARYWWPNPDDDGKYTLQREGITNPEIYDYDRPRLANFASAVYTLSIAYYFSGNEDYAEKATELIQNWFTGLSTRMNPNLEYAQIKKGVDEFAWQKIIDANDFVPVVEAISLLYGSAHWDQNLHRELKAWYYNFTRWFVGRYNPDAFCGSAQYCNNVSTWMDVQRLSFFQFSEQEELLNRNSHIMPADDKIRWQFIDGVQPNENNRHGAEQHYTYYNLRAFVKLATMRKNRGSTDRDWPVFDTPNYGGLKPAIDALITYLDGGDVSEYFSPDDGFDDCRYLQIFRPAAVTFGSQAYADAADELIARGCSNPDITLVYPPLHMLQNAGIN